MSQANQQLYAAGAGGTITRGSPEAEEAARSLTMQAGGAASASGPATSSRNIPSYRGAASTYVSPLQTAGTYGGSTGSGSG